MTTFGEARIPVDMLLVEDSPGDVRLTQEAFRDANRYQLKAPQAQSG